MAPEFPVVDYRGVPRLVLTPPGGHAVEHLLLRIDAGQSLEVRRALANLNPSFHGDEGSDAGCVSAGFSAAGLEALGVPRAYRRVFSRLAPAYSLGAVRRSVQLGDSGLSAAERWEACFAQSQAHLLVSWHGSMHWVSAQKQRFLQQWPGAHPDQACFSGQRIGAPAGQSGEWVHYGFRDGLSEVLLPGLSSSALDPRGHAAGALLLGEVDDLGVNRFALPGMPEKVRRFFSHGSFAAFRPMEQDVEAFEAQLGDWSARTGESVDWIKAKLCGRWPDGRVIAASTEPSADYDMRRALQRDRDGMACPFGSHARRMRAPLRDDGLELPRPLQRRSVPYGPAVWSPSSGSDSKPKRGLLGHFFCASIEQQFEHLLSQWAAKPPLDLHPRDSAADPLIGEQAPGNALLVRREGQPALALRGLGSWTRTRGTMYAWYPQAEAWQALLDEDYVADEDLEPWL